MAFSTTVRARDNPAADAFAADCLAAIHARHHLARSLWPNPADRADGIQETLCKALANRHRFDGGANLGGWLYTVMLNVRRDQTKRGRHTCVEYRGGPADYAADLLDYADPEAILLAKESLHQHRPTSGSWGLHWWRGAMR